MNDILRPITEDGQVGFDQFDQLLCWTPRGEGMVGRFIKDVRELTCCICNHGWEASAEAMADQRHWQLTDSWVHETCLIRHAGLCERSEFRQAMFDARTGDVGVRFEAKDIPNRYWGDRDPYGSKPWYQFFLLDFPIVFTIGSRKRVVVIEVESTDGGELAWWKAAEDYFAPEGVTKAFGYQRVMLHAWGKEKLREYVKKLAWFAEGSP